MAGSITTCKYYRRSHEINVLISKTIQYDPLRRKETLPPQDWYTEQPAKKPFSKVYQVTIMDKKD